MFICENFKYIQLRLNKLRDVHISNQPQQQVNTVTCINAVVTNSIRKIALSCFTVFESNPHARIVACFEHLNSPTTWREKRTEYGLEACPLRKSDCSSLDFVVNRFFMKLFKTNNIDVVNYYTSLFTITVAKIRKVNKLQQCEAKQLN